ncbi:MAG: hypothetical protein QOF84_1618 [Streptomyces sp.]|nr:hypothetical protein [Streptomyces sp.]
MSETIGTEETDTGTVREAYAFVCISCGFGWEQAYEIQHHVDLQNHPYVTYIADGKRVPSPLTRPACANCEGRKVRIMRAGQVSDVIALLPTQSRRQTQPQPQPQSQSHEQETVRRTRNWSPLHLLHRKSREERESA